jgi:transaldolase
MKTALAFTAGLVKTKVFADGADIATIKRLASNPIVAGFTTNPTLMRRAGVTDYERFAKDALSVIGERPISFEVFSDDTEGMLREARIISSWGPNVYVKVPITTVQGESSTPLLRQMASYGIKLNVTAILTQAQINEASDSLSEGPECCLSLFAGRIADTGLDPVPFVKEALRSISMRPHQQLIWASTREVLNVVQASNVGCHIITVTHDILAKLDMIGRNLTDLSLETVRMFSRDASDAGFSI